jgi:hypothetical protein
LENKSFFLIKQIRFILPKKPGLNQTKPGLNQKTWLKPKKPMFFLFFKKTKKPGLNQMKPGLSQKTNAFFIFQKN